MEPKNIGYIILEQEDEGLNEYNKVVKEDNDSVYCTAIFQDGGKQNRNGRWYSTESLTSCIVAPRTVELIGARALRSEQGHPLDKSLERQTVIVEGLCSCIILELHMDGNLVKGTYTNTENERGIALAREIRRVNYKPAFSLRALGSLQQTKRGAEVNQLRLITYDEVVYPSHSLAYTQEVLTKTHESALLTESISPKINDLFISYENKNPQQAEAIPILNSDVVNYLKSESANVKFVSECFDFMYNNIKLNDKGSSVILTSRDGEVVVVNLEQYIARELMNYATSRI